MDIVGKARQFERRISRTVDAAVGEFVGQSPTAPIEIVHGVLERAEAEIQDLGRGRHLFPYNIVRLQLVAAPGNKGARARLAAVVDGPPPLSERLADRLRTSGCSIERIETTVTYVRRRGPSWAHPDFHVEFDRTDGPSSSPVPEARGVVARLKITVIKGVAEQRSYAFSGGRIDVGRRSDVVDQRQRLIRTNHVAFAEDGPDENRTVSRRHAHIEFVERDRCYRLWDDRSVHGTMIIRNGRAIRVPAGSRGTKLQSDDEIVLGQTRLRVVVEKKP